MARIVKVLLADEGMYILTQDDKNDLEHIEHLSTYEIMGRDGDKHLY